MKTQVQLLKERVSEFEEAFQDAVAEIDQTDGSRIQLQNTLDSVREILENASGESFTDATQAGSVQNPSRFFGKKKEYDAAFWTDDGEYHYAILKGRNKTDAKRFAQKGWGKNIEFDYIEEA